MTEEGFTNPNRKNKKEHTHPHSSKTQRSFSQYQNFQQLDIKGKMKVTIEKADQYAIEATGKEQYLNKVKVEQDQQQLSIHTDLTKTSSPIRVTIKLPTLTSLNLSQTDDIRLSGFQEDKMTIKADGTSRADIKAFMDVKELEVDLNSRLELDIRGSGTKLIANLSDRAELDAERFAVKTAQVALKDRGNASLAVSDTLRQTIKDQGRIQIDGEPVVINFE